MATNRIYENVQESTDRRCDVEVQQMWGRFNSSFRVGNVDALLLHKDRSSGEAVSHIGTKEHVTQMSELHDTLAQINAYEHLREQARRNEEWDNYQTICEHLAQLAKRLQLIKHQCESAQ